MSDKVIATLPVWGPGYEISFEFYLNSEVPSPGLDYQWLFAVLGSDTGPGQPRIYYIDGRLAIWFRLHDHVIGKPYGAGDTLDLWRYPYGDGLGKNVELKKWHHISVSSVKEDGKVRL